MLCAFCILTVGAVVGLTYVTMYALKDTSVRGLCAYRRVLCGFGLACWKRESAVCPV
jgi:hypothetical protein